MPVRKTGPQAAARSAPAAQEPRAASTGGAAGTPVAGQERPGDDPLPGEVSGQPSGRRPSPARGPRREDSGYQRGGCEVWPD